ncbi:fumarylacetoacetate hydrolase family protein [Polynucleobacter wuianus]|uniref:fumarylacetoacetate hydrolase family protein n=1 Tax=Polynucleobacter wuianus TaxID=1743168 RepID=UPI001C0C1932|nr:fumarylacetoacetate hydrolase family protein [Polynucleobacter wuianus]MBU3611153.1 fumarylacetoacetate hydrolase family protein [Polynucleobacter wuianus]
MKLLNFKLNGISRWGALTDEGVIDLMYATNDSIRTLGEALNALSVSQIEELASAQTSRVDVREITYLPVITENKKILCVGLNYEEHRVEANRPKTGEPTLFVRFASSQVGHQAPLVLPKESAEFDYEGEIAIVIGVRGRRISEKNAWQHIAGYALYNDGSIRDWQKHTSQWTPGKNFDATASFGPYLVTRGEIADGQVLELTTVLNGQVMQYAKTDQLIFSIPTLIHYISSFCTLEPGDVIVTGTPGGVGFKRVPPVFMKPGDVVEIKGSNLGVLKNIIVSE